MPFFIDLSFDFFNIFNKLLNFHPHPAIPPLAGQGGSGRRIFELGGKLLSREPSRGRLGYIF
jgi:hypothetical protein